MQGVHKSCLLLRERQAELVARGTQTLEETEGSGGSRRRDERMSEARRTQKCPGVTRPTRNEKEGQFKSTIKKTLSLIHSCCGEEELARLRPSTRLYPPCTALYSFCSSHHVTPTTAASAASRSLSKTPKPAADLAFAPLPPLRTANPRSRMSVASVSKTNRAVVREPY